MPNLVPISLSPVIIWDALRFGVSGPDRASHEAKREAFLFMVARAEHAPESDRKPVPQADKRASVTTSHDTLACQLRQWQRIAGILGVTPLDTRYESDGMGVKVRWTPTAKGTGTRTVNLDRCGLTPSDQFSIAYEQVGTSDMSKTARYAGEYRGAEFAKSAQREADKRDREWFRNAFPYWPTDDRGRILPGKPTRDGKDRYFDLANGVRVKLSECREAYEKDQQWVDACADELRKLQADQEAERTFDRKHSKRTRMAW